VLWGGWQGASDEYVRSDLRGASNAARQPKALSPSGLRRFFAFPALLVDYRPLPVCALLAPWKVEKSAATRHG